MEKLWVVESHGKSKFCSFDSFVLRMTRHGQCKIERDNNIVVSQEFDLKYFKTRKVFEFLKQTGLT